MPDDPSPPGDSDAPSRIMSLRRRLAQLISGEAASDAVAIAAAQPASPTAMRLRLNEFETASVRDVMTSRVDIAAIDVSATLSDVLQLFVTEAHSRMPVFRDSLDEPLGFVHIKDVVAELVRAGWSAEHLASRPLERLMRDIMFVPESTRLPDLMVQMQTSRTHIAIVIDEYGGTGGMVCLEDMVEQIVGDIEDEHDKGPPKIQRRGRSTWDVDGLAEIDDVERVTGLTLRAGAADADVDTVGGLVAAVAGRLPVQGDVIEHPSGRVMEVIAVDPRRVTRVRLRPAGVRSAAPVLAAGEADAVDRRDA